MWLVSNFYWAVYNYLAGEYCQAVIFLAFFGLSVYGLFSWSKEVGRDELLDEFLDEFLDDFMSLSCTDPASRDGFPKWQQLKRRAALLKELRKPRRAGTKKEKQDDSKI